MTPKKPARSPRIPGTSTDRTGSAGILRRANAAIRARFAGLLKEALAIFARVRVLSTNAEDFGRTVYMMTPDEAAATSYALQQALDRWILDGRTAAETFWWSAYVSDAASAGTVQSVANLTALSRAYAGARTLQTIAFSQPYRPRVALAQIRSYDHWTGLAAGQRAELSQIIGRAVADGRNPRAVRKEITERLGVSERQAYSYAQTDITNTLRDARMAEKAAAEEEFGLNLGLLWTSALLPMTRPWHASRNGKVYTTEQVQQFYSERGNKYRCHCGITECLLDEDGRPILSDAAKATFKRERASWERTRKPR